MSIDVRLKSVFADAFETTPEQIDEDLSVHTSETWDSMRSIILASSLEDEFGVEFTDHELVTLDSFKKIEAMLLHKGAS